MKNRRSQLVRPAVIAVVVVGIVVAPAARAANQDLGSRAALAAVQEHRQRAPVTRSVTIVEPSTFDWGDAGVGAAAVLALMLLAGGVALASRHNHRRAT